MLKMLPQSLHRRTFHPRSHHPPKVKNLRLKVPLKKYLRQIP